MKPIYEVSIAGQIIDFGGRLVSLQIVQDRERFNAWGCDSVEIMIDDTKEPRHAIPPYGRALRVKLGYEGHPMADKGIYIVDEVEVEGPPDRLIIRAQNNPRTPHSDSFRPLNTRENRSWQTPLTVQDLVNRVAIDHGLFPQVSPTLASLPLPHIDQINMSDDELLNQYVAKIHDAYVLIQDSRLIVVKNGGGQTTGDVDIPAVFVSKLRDGETPDPDKNYISSYRVRLTDSKRYETVKASWHDYASAEEKWESVGTGDEPILRLPFVYPDRATAKAAAQTGYNRSNCVAGELTAAFSGVPQLFAGGRLYCDGLHPDLDRAVWYLRRVVHTFGVDGFWTEVVGERLTADMIAEMAQ